jgi:hypothetical protein
MSTSLYDGPKGYEFIFSEEDIKKIATAKLEELLKKPIDVRVQYYSDKISEEYIDSIIEKIIPDVITKAVGGKLSTILGVKHEYGNGYNVVDGGPLSKIVNSLINEVAEKRVNNFIEEKKELIEQIARDALRGDKRREIADIKYKVESIVAVLFKREAERIINGLINGEQK